MYRSLYTKDSTILISDFGVLKDVFGLGFGKFTLQGMGGDKYKFLMMIWGLHRPVLGVLSSYYSDSYIFDKLGWASKNLINYLFFIEYGYPKHLIDADGVGVDVVNNKFKKFKLKLDHKPFIKYFTTTTTPLNGMPVYSGDVFLSPTQLNILNFNHYNNDSALESLDNNYENIKNIKHVYYFNNKNTHIGGTGMFTPVSYTTVLDYFRADFDEHVWSLNTNLMTRSGYYKTDSNKLHTLTNGLKLRATAKNSIVTYNAIQKVYKSRFDDARSNTNFGDFLNSYSRYPFLIEPKTAYESMLGKNKESYFNPYFYTKELINNHSVFSDSASSMNMVFLDIPFLLSMKSDASRYLWFD